MKKKCAESGGSKQENGVDMTITLTDRLTEHFKIIESLTRLSTQSEGNTPNPFIKICPQTHARLLYCCSSRAN